MLSKFRMTTLFIAVIVTLLRSDMALAFTQVLCADPNKVPAYNTSDSPSNNVPIKHCYLKPNTYNCVFHNGSHSEGGVDEPCPSFVAGKDCCRWIKTSPVGGGSGGNGGGAGGNGGGNGGGAGGIGVGIGAGKNPCESRGLNAVSGNPFNLNLGPKDFLCCSSKSPREDMFSGKKVCCELVKLNK